MRISRHTRRLLIPTLLGLTTVGAGCYGGRDEAPADTDDGTDGATSADGEGGDGDDPIPEDLDPRGVPLPLAIRLNDTQYGNTVADVLGVELTEDERDLLPRDVPIEGDYSTSGHSQFFNTQYVLGYAYIARSLSERLDPGALQLEYGGCEGVDEACLEAFVEGLGLRLFRRPLTDRERAAYLELAAAIDGSGLTGPDDVVRGLLQGMLQAPPFLYRMEAETAGEPGQLRRTSGWELASRLSYFLWQSAPDEDLLAFAAGPAGDGDYVTDELAAQIERMIADPRFARSRRQFWGDYSLASVASFGAVEASLGEELRESLLASFDRLSGVGASAQPLSAVYDGYELVMTPGVAELAGVAPKGEGLQVYGVDELEQRRGLITHPAFVAAMGTTSFVGRGVFMTERLLCQHTSAPPDDDATAAEIMQTAQATADMTPREASEFRFGLQPVCLSCHTQFEPIAYAFERYDMAGRFTLTDAQGRALYSDGSLPAFGERPEIPFDDAPQLLAELAARPEITHCFVENMMEFAQGSRPVFAADFIDQALLDLEAEGQTFDALVHAVAGGERLTLVRTVTE